MAARLGLILALTLILSGDLALAPLTSAQAQSAPVPTAGPGLVNALVTRVIDGSSLDAHIAGVRVAVGYLGVETPPANTPCGQQALARNRELAGDQVLLEADPAYQLDETYRRLYYAYTPDGVSIDETLIREGLGRAVRTDAAHGAALAAAEAAAAGAGRGCLWDGSSG